MITLARLIQFCHEWSLRHMARRLAARLKRSVKRRMKGESHRQWMERSLHDSEAGILLDIVQSFVSGTLLMVVSIIDQNWTRSNYTHKRWYQVFDVANLLSIAINFSLREQPQGLLPALALAHRHAHGDPAISPVGLHVDANGRQSVPVSVPADAAHDPHPAALPTASPCYDGESAPSMTHWPDHHVHHHLRRRDVPGNTHRSLSGGAQAHRCPGRPAGTSASLTRSTLCASPSAQLGTSTLISVQELTCTNVVGDLHSSCVRVSFGDIVPLTKSGKMMDILLIVIAGAAISTQLGEYTDILSRETAFDKKYEPDKSIQHILLCGEIENGALRFFLHNWLHTESERGNRKRREYEQRVVYLQGSAMVAADLQRAAAPTAAYCFVMVKKHSETLDQNDTAANLLTCSVSKFDNVRHVNISGASSVVCLEQLRLAMVAKSLWIKGFNTFLANLVQRFGAHSERDTSGFWLANYLSGCSYRVYETGLPRFLDTLGTFKALATLIYREFKVPIIGLRSIEETAVVFPVDKALADVNFQSILILSQAKDIALKIEKLTPSVLQRHTDLLPDGHNPDDEATRGSMAGLITTMEGKLPFRSMSVAFVDDNRASTRSARGLRSSTRSVRSLRSIGRQNSKNDKITPLQSDEDYGDAKSMRDHDGVGVLATLVSPRCKPEKRVSIVRFLALLEHGASATEDDENLLPTERDETRTATVRVRPVVALSPAELMKKATSPYAAPPPRTPRTSRSIPASPRGAAAGGGKVYSGIDAELSHHRNDRITAGAEEAQEPPRTHRNSSSARKSAVSPDSVAIDSETARRRSSGSSVVRANGSHGRDASASELHHTTTNSNGRVEKPSVEQQIEVAPEDDFIVEAPVIQRRISNSKAMARLRRVSMARSFRRVPPPRDLADHFVVCGMPSDYPEFLANLSDDGEPRRAPVVFVTPRALTDQELQVYARHKALYFVRGSPVSMQVFDDARMRYTRSILIMSYCAIESDGEDDETDHVSEQMDDNMADVDAITTHRFISEARQQHQSGGQQQHQQRRSTTVNSRPMPFIVAEMIRLSNAKFLIDYGARCHIYFTNTMDALLGACSQNPLLIDMVTQLVVAGKNNSKSSRNPLSDDDSETAHRLSQIPAPPRFHFRPYALLVEDLLREEVLLAIHTHLLVS
ncbi:Voltage-gated ion channel superfamily, partial [Globisporangium splendens]